MNIRKVTTLIFSFVLTLGFDFAALAAGTSFPIANTSVREMSVSAAFDGTNFLVGIQGDAIAVQDITAQFVSKTGALVGSPISTGGTGGAPGVAFDGTNYLLVWEQDATYSTAIFGQLVSTSGVLVGSQFTIASDYNNIKSMMQIIFDGTNYFVAWHNESTPGNGDTRDVYGQFVTPSGTLLGSVIPISTAAHGQRDPAIAFDGTNILAVWTDGRNQSACYTDGTGTHCYESDVYGQIITKSGASAGTLSWSNFLIDAGTLPRDNPTGIAFDGTNYLITFVEETTLPNACPVAGCNWEAYGILVTEAGAPSGSKFVIGNTTTGVKMLPAPTYLGTQYLVTWTDGMGTTSASLKGQYVTTSGAVSGSEFTLFSPASSGAVPWFSRVFTGGGVNLAVTNWGIPDMTDPFNMDLYTNADVYGFDLAPVITAVAGGQTALTQFANTINSQGANLDYSHLLPFFDAGFLSSGVTATNVSMNMASSIRGLTLSGFFITKINSYDDVNGIINAAGVVTINGLQQYVDGNNADGFLIFKRQSDGSWKFFGNQRIARIYMSVEMRTDYTPESAVGPVQRVGFDIEAPVGTLSLVSGAHSVTATPNLWGAALPLAISPGSLRVGELVQASPLPAAGVQLPDRNAFDGGYNTYGTTVSAGQVFQVSLTPTSGPAVTYDITYFGNAVTNTTTGAITNVTINGGEQLSFASSALSSPLSVAWTLPTAYTISRIGIDAAVFNSNGQECLKPHQDLANNATVGTALLPTSCGTGIITRGWIFVSVVGTNGELSTYNYAFNIVRGVDDFNGDGISDILWRNNTSGQNIIWKSANSATMQTVAAVADLTWTIANVGDFDGDGRADILWRNSTSGQNIIWKSGNSATRQAMSAVSVMAWKIAGSGDFNGDGISDILWRNSTSGQNIIWKSANSATMQTVAAVADPTWTIASVGDFDGDGKADILWRNNTSGQNIIWKSGNSATRQAMSAVPVMAWKIAGSGDFNGDGISDILWRNNTSGQNIIWRSANSATMQTVAAVADLTWTIASVGDFDGDGKADILWRNSTSGQNIIWKSGNSATRQAVSAVSVMVWQVQ